MPDIIQLLPDSVANQIAAGEVVQRPASVVKELVENAIDAGATEITISIVDAGRTIIQVVDNGKGMSETDARMSLERHATSKIRTADDIFSIRSMGFRGEALASIAAVSHLELKTRMASQDIGTRISIKGSELEIQEPIACNVGTSFTVKNLFYNIPARRKFLKTNQTEFKYILDEIYHTALSHCHISFIVYKDDELYAKYPIANCKQRIIAMFGKRMEKGLLAIEGETSIVKISGYIGTPEMAKKNNYDQYLFVNNRYFKQKSFQSAVMRAYHNILPAKEFPPFFIFFEIDPAQIDVNIHPTKTEIKFVEEYNVSQLLEATVKHSLGKSNVVPSMDFLDEENYSDMFMASKSSSIKIPGFDLQKDYNPFDSSSVVPERTMSQKQSVENWETLFTDSSVKVPQQTFASALNNASGMKHEPEPATCIQIQKKYILTTGKTGLMIVDIKRAHSRILYEKFIKNLTEVQQPSQKSLIPIRIETNHSETEQLLHILPQLQAMGFDIEPFGQNSFVVHGAPADVEVSQVEYIIHSFIEEYSDRSETMSQSVLESIAQTMAKSSALYRNPVMRVDEMQVFLSQLFQCPMHSLSADGKIAVVMLEYDEIGKKFNV